MSNQETAHGTMSSYISGFVLSIVLTLSAYLLVQRSYYSHSTLVISVVVLALTQLVVQLLFFLHLGRGSKPRWNLIVFGFMLMVVVIIVFGSLWIMHNLNYAHQHNHLVSPDQGNTYILKDEGIPQ